MKKVAILSAVNIKHMSLISLYMDILKKSDVQVDLIYMDKYGEDEPFDCDHKYRYVKVIDRNWGSLKKAFAYLSFVPYAKRILNKNQYDFIIVWNDLAIFMFADYLRRKYKGKYCVNIRDNMFYDSVVFRRRYEKCFLSSAFNTISSKGYLDFLPRKPEYLQIHSLNLSALREMTVHDRMREEGEPIRIGFIGYVRFFERNKKLLDAFKNDDRFELHYYGKGAEVLEQYAKENGIENTRFHGGFPVSETAHYLEQIDVINNLYGNETLNLRKAISIKFYHALYARIPILVCPDTYVGSLAKELGIGFEVDDADITACLPESIFRWYKGLDFRIMDSVAGRYLAHATAQNRLLEQELEKYLS